MDHLRNHNLLIYGVDPYLFYESGDVEEQSQQGLHCIETENLAVVTQVLSSYLAKWKAKPKQEEKRN